MRKISRKTAVLSMGLLFILPILFYFQNAQAIWILPEQITDNYIVRDDNQITVTFDGKGYIHFASILYDAQSPENYLYYGNNSKPGYTDSDFLEAEGDKEELGNRAGDGLNLTNLELPSISASDDGTPIIGFDANVVEFGHNEAFASVVDTKSGVVRRHQLSYQDQYLYQSAPYTNFNQIVRVGTNLIAARNDSYAYYEALPVQTTLNPGNQTRLNFLSSPNEIVYNGSILFVAAGKTLLIFSAPSLTAIGHQLAYMPFENDIDALWYHNDTQILFLTVKNRIYAIDVSRPAAPSIQASESFDVEGMYSIIGKGMYLYIACGMTGMKTIRYFDREFTSTMTRPNPNPGKAINDVVFGNSNNLHIAGDDGLYTSLLTNPAEPTGLTLKSNTGIISPIIDIVYNSTANKLALAMRGSTNLLFFDNYEGFSNQYPAYVTTQAPLDLEIDTDYIYAAVGSSGFLKLNIVNPWVPVPSYADTENCTQITNYGTYTIASDLATDISVINYNTMVSIGSKSMASGAGPMYVDNNYVYVNDQRYGLVIADANDISNVKLVTIKNLSGPMYGDIFVYNRIVYIAGESGYADLAVIDASNFGSIASPIYYNFTDATLKDVIVLNNGTQTWGYATNFTGSSLIYFNLTNNLLIPSYNSTLTGLIASPTKMTYADKKIYIAGINGVQTVGIANMGVPTDDGENAVTGGPFKEIEIEDGVIFVGDSTATVRYYDLTTPTTIRSEVVSSAANDFLIFDCAIFAATQSSGIGVFDVSKHDGTPTTGDNTVSIAHFSNGTAVAIWMDGSSNLYYRKIYPNNIKSQIHLIGTYNGILTPQFKISQVENDSFIHIVFANSINDDIWYIRAKNTFTFPAAVAIASEATYEQTNPRVSVEKSVIGIVWEHSNQANIQGLISIDNGTTFGSLLTITTGTNLEYAPDLYVTWDGKCEVVYQKQMTALNYSVFSRNNVDGSFDEECLLMDYTAGVTCFENPRIAQKFGTVVIFYEYAKFEGSLWWAAEINVLGYQILNYNMNGNYKTLTIRDDPVGNWLFSGFRIGFNTTTLNDIKLNFTIVDNDTVPRNTTYAVWSNVTTIPGNGTQNREFYFYSPGNYFITHSNFTLYIRNASDLSSYLIKIPLDSYQLQSVQIYNVTTPGSNGTFLNYSLAIYPIFEYGNNLILDTNQLENEENPYFGSFGLPNSENPSFLPNFVDLKYFTLEENRRYNFYLYNNTFSNATSGHFRLRLYNDSTILTNKDTPYITIDSQNLTTAEFRCPVEGTYGALIEPAFASDYGRIMEYKFYFSAVPLPTSLMNPKNRTFIAHTDNSTNTTIQPISLNWGYNIRDSDIVKFQIQVFTNESLPLSSLVYNITVLGIGTKSIIFNATDQTGYYWRVRGIDDSTPANYGDWGPLGIFYYDPTPPEAPDVYALPWDTSVNYVSMQWNASYDGPYIVPRYYIYIANRPVFVEGMKPEDKYIYDASGVTTLGVVLKNLRNYHYYIVVIAEDNVGQRSNASKVVEINVAIGGYISAVGKEFGVQVGDTFLYEITYVESSQKDVNQQPTMEYFYRRYPVNAQFHFWVQYFDTSQVYPILATFYSRNQYEWDNDWFLVDDQIPITLFTLAKDETYQRDVFALYVQNNVFDTILGNQTYDTLWRRGTDVLNVRVFTFYGNLDGDGKQTSISFFVEKTSGVVCEMIYYDKSQNYGYSIQLVETSITMTHNDWQYSPLYLILALAAIGAIISGIIKKVEF